MANKWGGTWATFWGASWDFAVGALGVDEPRSGGTWFNSQADRDRLLKEDEGILNFVTTFVTSGIADGQS